MNEILRVNPKFEQIIPPLAADEFAQLEENILKQGRVTDPIKVWNGVIVDGHHRYKIIQKYPEIPYTTDEIKFDNEYEAFVWICNSQLGRRNINELHRAYLLGKRYRIEKKLNGGDRKSKDAKSLGQNSQVIPHQSTRSKIAEETKTTEAYVRQSDEFARGVDAADEILPGIKNQMLSGNLNVPKSEVTAIARLPVEQRKEAVELLLVPKDKRDKSKEIARQIEEAFANGTEPEPEEEAPQEKEKVAPAHASVKIPEHTEQDKEDSKAKEHEIEESILNSMIGAVNMFIDSINNYLSRFPRLRTDPKYRSQTREIMVAARDYINDVEGDLL